MYFQLISIEGVVAEGFEDEDGKVRIHRTDDESDGFEFYDNMEEVTELFSYADVYRGGET